MKLYVPQAIKVALLSDNVSPNVVLIIGDDSGPYSMIVGNADEADRLNSYRKAAPEV